MEKETLQKTALAWLTAHRTEMLEFLVELIKTPSQNGVDTEQAVAQLIAARLDGFGFAPRLVGDPARPSVLCEYSPRRADRPTLWLEAPLDTVVAGERAGWRHDPFAAQIEDGKLYGRGAADCKAAIAIFVYVAAALRAVSDEPLDGNLVLSFDADEQGAASPASRLCWTRWAGWTPV